jgi:hypothetical protein
MWISDRIEVTEGANDLGVRIGPRRNITLWVFLSIWLSFWTFGGITSMIAVATGHTDRGFISFWLVGWLVGEVLATTIWFWNGFGVETIFVRQGAFEHSRSIFGRTIGRKSIPLSEIVNIQPHKPSAFLRYSNRQLSISGGEIKLDYNSDAFDFGYQLERDEAGGLANVLATFVSESKSSQQSRRNESPDQRWI